MVFITMLKKYQRIKYASISVFILFLLNFSFICFADDFEGDFVNEDSTYQDQEIYHGSDFEDSADDPEQTEQSSDSDSAGTVESNNNDPEHNSNEEILLDENNDSSSGESDNKARLEPVEDNSSSEVKESRQMTKDSSNSEQDPEPAEEETVFTVDDLHNDLQNLQISIFICSGIIVGFLMIDKIIK